MRLLSGQKAFVVQRVTALLILGYLAAAAIWFAFGPSITYAQWQAWNARPLTAVATMLLAVAVLAHAWVGVRDVVLDYVKPFALRLAVLASAGAALTGLGAWTALILASHVLAVT